MWQQRSIFEAYHWLSGYLFDVRQGSSYIVPTIVKLTLAHCAESQF